MLESCPLHFYVRNLKHSSQVETFTEKYLVSKDEETVVLGKNGRLLSILSDGSRDRIPVFLSFIWKNRFSINPFHVANDLSTCQLNVMEA